MRNFESSDGQNSSYKIPSIFHHHINKFYFKYTITIKNI